MSDTIKILILEDLDDDVELIKRVLSKEGVLAEIMQVDGREEYE
jgi:hypothetical protein